jgi:hypothetical protein
LSGAQALACSFRQIDPASAPRCGTIAAVYPAPVEPEHWLDLNTFRTQAQIEGGSVCIPPG